jgi:hypothetical protein
MIPMIRQEMLQGSEQVGSESASRLFSQIQVSTFQQSGKEAVSQLTRRIITTPLAAEKDHHRLIIGCTQITERRLRHRAITART